MSKKRGAVNIFKVLKNATKGIKEKEQIRQEDTLRMNITLAMVKIRKSLGLSQEEVAKRLGVSQSWVSRLENANYDHQIESIWKYLKALGAELSLNIKLPEKYVYILVSDTGKPAEYSSISFIFNTSIETYILDNPDKRTAQNKENYDITGVDRYMSGYPSNVA